MTLRDTWVTLGGNNSASRVQRGTTRRPWASCPRAGAEESHSHRAHDSACFREAVACVRQNVFLRDMNVNLPAQDSGWLWTSLCAARSAAPAKPTHRPRRSDPGAGTPGQKATFPELASCGRCKLVVLATETGGRWSEEAVQTHAGTLQSARRTSVLMWKDVGRECWPSRAVSFASSLVELARKVSWCRADGETPLVAALCEGDPRWGRMRWAVGVSD